MHLHAAQFVAQPSGFDTKIQTVAQPSGFNAKIQTVAQPSGCDHNLMKEIS